MPDSGASDRLVMARLSRSPPSSWISAIELTPKLNPNVAIRFRFPFSPDAG